LEGGNAWALGTRGQIERALGRKKEAIVSLRQAEAIDPDLKWVHIELAELLLDQDQSEAALEEVDRALAPDPRAAPLLSLKGRILLVLDRCEDAVAPLKEALEIDPGLAEAHTFLGRALRALGQPKDALAELDRAIELEPSNAMALGFRGQALKDLGRLDEAEESLQRALELDPDRNWVQTNLAETFLASGRTDEALELIDRGLATDPTDTELTVLKARALRDLSRLDDAVALLETSAERDPSSAELQAELGESLRLVGRLDDALGALDRALELSPQDAWVVATKGQVLRMLNRPDEALKLLQEAEESYKQSWVYSELGESYRLLDRHAEALEAFDRALELAPGDLVALSSRGAVLGAIERYDEAFEALDQALTIDGSDQAWIRGVKGTLYCDVGDFASAVDELEQAIALEPGLAWLHQAHGWALQHFRPERFADALMAFRSGLAIESDELWCLKGEAEALLLLEQSSDAAEHFKRTIAIAEKKGDRAPNTLALVGWCHYQLKNYDSAVRSYLSALSRDSTMIDTRFDLGLAMMCSQEVDPALQEYLKGIEESRRRPPLKRRGLLQVALIDLDEATRFRKFDEEASERASEARERLQAAFQDVKDLRPRSLTLAAARP